MADPLTKRTGAVERCPSCPDGGDTTPAGPVHNGVPNGVHYSLVRCTHCDLRFWSPLRADPAIYAGEGFEAYADYHAGRRPFPRWALPLFEILPAGGGAALDIGCGDGAVLARLRDHGFDPHGIDLDERSIAIARSKHGLTQTHAETLDRFARWSLQNRRSFAVVTFFEVLEHQDDPRAFLLEVAALCGPQTVVAGSVPHHGRFLAGLDRRLGYGDLPPHHFLWFTERALRRLLERCGFVDVLITRAGRLPIREVVAKLRRVLARRLPRAIAPLGSIAALVAAPLLWAGFAWRPTHLFFQCRIGETCAPGAG